jgi:hypothetical protein
LVKNFQSNAEEMRLGGDTIDSPVSRGIKIMKWPCKGRIAKSILLLGRADQKQEMEVDWMHCKIYILLIKPQVDLKVIPDCY